MIFQFIVAGFIAFPAQSAGLPKSIRKVINQLPNKKFSLDVVLTLGVTSSDQYKLIMSESLTKDLSRLQIEALLDSKVSASAGQVSGVLSPTGNPDVQGETQERDVSRLGLNYEKLFVTGTKISAGIEVTDATAVVESDPNIGGLQNIDQIEYKSTVKIQQQLWRNAFGRTIRDGLKAGKMRSDSVESSVQNQVDEYALGLIEVYYNTWLAQARVFADQARLARQKRLLAITKIQKARGNADQANVLQIKSALGFSQQLLSDSEQALGQIWRQMVTILKMPDTLLLADPKLIPLSTDTEYAQAMDLCRKYKDPLAAVSNAPRLKQYQNLQSAADITLENEKRESKPFLAVELKFVRNGVNGTAEYNLDQGNANAPGLYETFDPATYMLAGPHVESTIGVVFQMPIGNTEAKGKLINAVKLKTQADTGLAQVRSELAASWLNSCSALWRSSNKVDAMIQIYKDQLRRSRMEDRRFKLARISAFEVIGAGNDVTDSELAVASARRELRVNGWRVIQLHGGMKEQLERVYNKGIKVTQ